MKFKTDENVSPEVASVLRRKGHDVLTVWDQDLRGKADQVLAAACQAEQRALVTLDLGFADIRAYPPESFSSIIVLRLAQQSRKHVTEVLERVLPLLDTEPLAGCLWIVDESNVRVYGNSE